MKITVINGSPKGERSDTLKITKAFLRGMGENSANAHTMGIAKKTESSDITDPIVIIDTMKVDVKPCLGCYCCWHKTPGMCVQKDDMKNILDEISASDLIIWSSPLYCYSFPANCKAVLDRLLPLSSPRQYKDEKGNTHHPRRNEHRVQHMLISGCGFPDREGNYDGLIFQFQRMFGKDATMILCPEAPMFSVPEAAVVTEPYLALVEKAGSEFKTGGKTTDETLAALSLLMIPADEYRRIANG